VISALRLVTFPRDDAAFANRVQEAFKVLDEPGRLGTDKIVKLVRELLPAYPEVEIRQQDGLASFDADPMTWYVYRDGSV
jgi:hypothetical protein